MKLSYARALQLFRTLGAKDPTVWAHGEGKDGKPYVVRYLFLTGLWRSVLGDDAEWSEETPPVKRMLGKGIDPRDLTAVVRDAQCALLYEICQLIDNPAHGIEDLQEQIPENVEWRLCEVDEHEKPTGRVVTDLHASLNKFDPTGREGEPSWAVAAKKPRARTKSRRPAAKSR